MDLNDMDLNDFAIIFCLIIAFSIIGFGIGRASMTQTDEPVPLKTEKE